MVKLLEGFPPHVAAYEAQGKVDKDEYESIVMKRVDEVAAEYGKINFLVRLETGMENYSITALLKYLEVSFEHFKKWNRMAIVSDQQWVRVIYDTLSPLVPGKIKSYELQEYETAKQWVSGPLSGD
jgi:hypothetical protein